jgi:hypothetical protein
LGKIKVILDSDDASFLSKIIFHCGQNDQCFLNYFCLFAKNFDLLKFLKWFDDSFGLDQLKKLLLQRDTTRESIVFQFFSNYQNPITNGLDILNYLRVDLQLDENFVKYQIILRKTNWEENVLQQIFLRSESLDQFNNLIENTFEISDSELKSSLTGNKTNFFHIAQKSEEDQEKLLDFMKRRFSDDILAELISSETLCDICLQSHRFDDFGAKILKFFEFVEKKFGIDFIKKLSSYKDEDDKNQTFLFNLNQVIDKDLMKILQYLFEKFENEKQYLEQFLLSIDDDGNSFLIHYFSEDLLGKLLTISEALFKLIKDNFDLNFLKILLLIRNKSDRNLYHALLGNKYGGVEKSLKLLENLLEVLGNDQEFFAELTKQNEEIPEEIKNFIKLKVNLEKDKCNLM